MKGNQSPACAQLTILSPLLFSVSACLVAMQGFLMTAMTLLDVLAGVIVTIVSARRDFGVAGDV